MMEMPCGAPKGRASDLDARFALVVANGEVTDLGQLRRAAGSASLVVAADGGSVPLWKAGSVPDVVVGDLDSTPEHVLRDFAENNATIIAAARDKDETDLQLAITECRRRGFCDIVVFGAMGGRADHAFMNLSLLPALAASGAKCMFVDGMTEVAPVPPSLVIYGLPGDIVSLLPFDGEVKGVYTTGLAYALDGGCLRRGGLPAGVSNRMTGERATVDVASGSMLAFVCRRSEASRRFS